MDNVRSWDKINCNISHTPQNIVLTCVPCNIERSNRSLELMQTFTKHKQYAVDNDYPVVLTNIHEVEQFQEAIVNGLCNISHISNIVREHVLVMLLAIT
jgi:hypothetical protein